jgi:D-amino peptidase
MATSAIKVYISTDMEGIGGVVRPAQVNMGNPEYDLACGWMASEVNAYVRGALEAGATEVWVKDAHGKGMNMRWDAFPESVRLITGRTGLTRFPGLDSSFSAMFLVGYHAQAGTPDAVLDHTWSSATDTRFLFNGVEVGEIALDAAIAGVFGVPVALVSGDDKTATEAIALLGSVESVITKTAVTREGAVCLPLAKVLHQAETGALRAVERALRGEFRPFIPQTPLHCAQTWRDENGTRQTREAVGEDLRRLFQEVVGQG